jgi:enterochelin esterase-like enzyme
MTKRSFALTLAACLVAGRVIGMQTPVTPESALLTGLQRSLVAGEAGAVDRFWKTVTERTTPIIETLPGDDAHVLATFLWRDSDASVRDVVLQARPNGVDPHQDPRSHLRRLQDTDVWFASFHLPVDAEFIYQFALNPPAVAAGNPTPAVLRASLRTDPLNPHRYPEAEGNAAPPPLSQSVSIARMPGTPPNPWIVRTPRVPARPVHEHVVKSTILNGDRTVWVYEPPVQPLRDPHLLLLFDGQIYVNRIPTPAILDNLYDANKIAATIAVFIDNGGPQARESDLYFSDRYIEFLAEEVLPWVQQTYHFKATASRTVVGGSSFGGLTGAFAALRRPDVFGKVLSQSGSFSMNNPAEDGGREEWLVRQFAQAPKRDVFFSLEVGQMEVATNVLASNRHLRDVLAAKGYEVHYFEVFGAHEPVHWRRTLPESLEATLR